MHLAISPVTLLFLGSYVAAAPSIHHAQVSVGITNTDVQNPVDPLHSSEELVMSQLGSGSKSLRFNFTLSARAVKGSASLPFGFDTLDAPDGFAKGKLGITTEFAFRNESLIIGNRALGYNIAKIFPPWTSLWSLNEAGHGSLIELRAVYQDSRDGLTPFLVLKENDKVFGAHEIKSGEPIFVAPQEGFPVSSQLLLEIERIWKSSDNINADTAEQLL